MNSQGQKASEAQNSLKYERKNKGLALIILMLVRFNTRVYYWRNEGKDFKNYSRSINTLLTIMLNFGDLYFLVM